MTKHTMTKMKPEAWARSPSAQLGPRVNPSIAGEVGGQPALCPFSKTSCLSIGVTIPDGQWMVQATVSHKT